MINGEVQQKQKAEYRNPGKHKFMIRGKSSFSEWSNLLFMNLQFLHHGGKLGILIFYIFIIFELEKRQSELESVEKATDEIQTAFTLHKEIKDSIK